MISCTPLHSTTWDFNPCCWVDYIRSKTIYLILSFFSEFQSLLLSGLHSKVVVRDFGSVDEEISILVVEWITFEARRLIFSPKSSIYFNPCCWVDYIRRLRRIVWLTFHSNFNPCCWVDYIRRENMQLYSTQKNNFNPCCWVDYIRRKVAMEKARLFYVFQSLLLSGLHSKGWSWEIEGCPGIISILVVEWITFEVGHFSNSFIFFWISILVVEWITFEADVYAKSGWHWQISILVVEWITFEEDSRNSHPELFQISILVVEWITFEETKELTRVNDVLDFNPCCWVDYIRSQIFLRIRFWWPISILVVEWITFEGLTITATDGLADYFNPCCWVDYIRRRPARAHRCIFQLISILVVEWITFEVCKPPLRA